MRLLNKQYILVFCTLFAANIYAQTTNIKGVVKDSNEIALEGATVFIKKLNKGISTDRNGAFEFKNIKNGTYKITVSYVGFESSTKNIIVNDSTITINFILSEQNERLQEVEIIGRKEQSYKNTKSFSGTKSAINLKDLPQSVGYVTKEVVLDQAGYRLNDVVKNISGVNQHSFYNDLVIRGHRVSGQRNSSMMLNGMRIMTSFWKQQLIPHIEKVEVIKGPASALFGNASPGGVINSVTKKPLFTEKKSISSSVGSFNTFRILSDFTGPMDDADKLLYRLNIGYENSDGFRDLQFSKNLVVAPSFSFLPNDNTRLNLDVVYQDSKGRLDRGQAVFGNGDLYSVPVTKSLSAVNDFLNEFNLNVTLSFQHKFTEDLSFNSIYLNSSYDEDLLEHRTANSFAALGDGSFDISKVAMRVFERKRSWNNQNFTNYFNYKYSVGNTKNTLLVGFDYFQQELQAGGSQREARAYLLKNGTATNSFKIANKNNYVLDSDGNPVTNVAHFDLMSPTANGIRDRSNYVYQIRQFPQFLQSSKGIYIQNQTSINDKFDVLLGLRQDYFSDFINYKTEKEKIVEQQSFLPRLGLVYKANKNINIYGTWVRGYQPQSATQVSNPNVGGPFDPLTSELFEVGVKTEWFHRKLSATLALYDLTQRGALLNANDVSNPDRLVQLGKDKSKGIELDVYGKVMPNWSVILNYAYNHAFIVSASDADVLKFGNQKPNAPKHAFNFWSKYTINNGRYKGLGFGLGYDYVSRRLGSIVRDPKLVPIFPSYGLVNTALYYNVGKFQIQLNVNNIFNEIHWVGGYDFLRAFPGQTRNLITTVSYTF
ncbi:TonB-dependent receptor [Polaribacter cellanae]|uniref:TonB-dependent receptor n=1 Tax=Polaribacter cellanae TaxID=2818493 RepID=A0A975CSB4_9FLAO|nr:TonB-dependent receptor [Polaribacter cellanae]QTE24382.1 TonB-dependent receptor [Polaribacter cellanae]